MNSETARVALALMERGDALALATVLETRGSLPRHAGAAMLVMADGSTAGTIGGGPLEGRVIERALQVMTTGRASLEHFDSAALGMTCGGGGLVLIERLEAGDSAMRGLFTALDDFFKGGRRGWLVTVVPESDGVGSRARRCLLDSSGAVAGDPVCDSEMLQGLAKKGGTYDRIVGGDPARTFVQAIGGRGTAYVFGAGHCGASLVPLLDTLGFITVVIDDRADFAHRGRFPVADRIVVPESFEGVVDSLTIDEDSYIVIVTRGHAHDQAVLAQALRTRAYYIGMIGSKAKVAGCFEALTAQGFTAGDLARVHAPIGLPIGAETPEEIAVSIAAQLIQIRAAKEA